MADKINLAELRVSAGMDDKGYTAGVKRMTKANEEFAKASQKVDNSTERTQDSVVGMSRGLARLTSNLDPAVKAQVALERGQKTLRGAFERGKISAKEYSRYLGLLADKHNNKLSPALQRSRRSMEQYGKTTKLTRMQLLTIQYTVNDVAASLATGISPFTILMQQGGQVTQAWGGLGNTLRALISPARLTLAALGGVAFTLGAIVKGAANADKVIRSFEIRLAASGRAGMLNRKEINLLIESTSKLSSVSRKAAIESVTKMVQTRQIGRDMYSKLITLAGDYAQVTGSDLPEAMSELANGFKEVSTFANKLNKDYGILNNEQYKQIKAFEKAGEATKAQAILLEELTKAMKGAREKGVTPLSASFDALGNSWDDLKVSLSDSAWVRGFFHNTEAVVALTRAFFSDAEKLKDLNRTIGEVSTTITHKRTNGDAIFGQGMVNDLALVGLEKKLKRLKEERAELVSGSASLGRKSISSVTGVAKEVSGPTFQPSFSTGDTRTLEQVHAANKKAAEEAAKVRKKTLADLARKKKKHDEATTSLDRQLSKMRLAAELGKKTTVQAAQHAALLRAEPYLKQLSTDEQIKYVKWIEAGAAAEALTKARIKARVKEEAKYAQARDALTKKLSNTLASSFVRGTSAAEAFRTAYLTILEELAAKSILNVIINPIMKGASEKMSGTAFSAIGTIFSSFLGAGGGMASGGTVYPDHAYTVGEKGRETFIPSTQGTVVSNVAGGGTQAKQEFIFNVKVDGAAAKNPETAASAGMAFATAARAKIVEIIQQEQRPGGTLQGTV